MDATPQRAPRPLGLLAELTHRCPLGCPYCSNPLALEARSDELNTATWTRVFKEAAALGVLQVPASGQPILLMADRQTTGGYPKIATVIAADLTLAGQLAPADTITFVVCTPGDALRALIAQERALMALEDRSS